jgi:hypothetical protein
MRCQAAGSDGTTLEPIRPRSPSVAAPVRGPRRCPLTVVVHSRPDQAARLNRREPPAQEARTSSRHPQDVPRPRQHLRTNSTRVPIPIAVRTSTPPDTTPQSRRSGSPRRCSGARLLGRLSWTSRYRRTNSGEVLPSRFGPTSAVFRAYRITEDDPHLNGMTLSAAPYNALNARTKANQTLGEDDEKPKPAGRTPRPTKARATTSR